MEILKTLACASLLLGLPASPSAAGDCLASADAPRPRLAAKTFSGEETTLSSQHGRPILLDVWATWCHSCKQHLINANELAREIETSHLSVIAISIDSDIEDAREWLAKQLPNARLETWHATPGATFSSLDIDQLPATLLLDATGRIIDRLQRNDRPEADRLLRLARRCSNFAD